MKITKSQLREMIIEVINESLNEASDSELVKNMQQTIKDLETKLKATKDSKEREMIKKNIAVNTGLMNFWKTRNEVVSEVDPCWDGYTQLGTKMKDGKEVPNCVPVSEANVIKNLKEADTEYQTYFRKELEKTGKSSPADMTDDEKKKFFTQVDKGWTGKNESFRRRVSEFGRLRHHPKKRK